MLGLSRSINKDVTIGRLFARGLAHIEVGYFRKTNRLFFKIQKSTPDNPDVLHPPRICAIKTGHFAQSVRYRQLAAKIILNSSEIWNVMVAGLRLTQRSNKATSNLERTITQATMKRLDIGGLFQG